ncbi:acyl-CoA synthetase [Halorubrum trueperi]|uniref:Acyl-CoA synthetase n=1 Tax=Halorubrum trueperi TaxID=2004704 RepID=A0ABD5UG89_9EURY
MFDNVPASFVPDSDRPDLVFAHPDFDWAYNTDQLNTTAAILDQPVEAAEQEDSLAVVDEDFDREVTYGELQDRVNRLGNALLDAGLEPGDRVLYRLPTRLETLVTILALWKTGLVAVPSNHAHQARELEYFVTDTEASAIITTTEDLEATYEAIDGTETLTDLVMLTDEYNIPDVPVDVAIHDYEEIMEAADTHLEAADTAPLDVANICYTGGTTGKPKGCIWLHASNVAGSIVTSEDRAIDESSIMFNHAPMGHGFGMIDRTLTIRNGPTQIFKARPSPNEVVQIIDEHNVTRFGGVPTIWRMIINEGLLAEHDLSSLSEVLLTGETTDRETFDRITEHLGFEPCNVVGMNPMGGVFPFIRSYSGGDKVAPLHSVGRPVPGLEAKVVNEDGEQVARGELGRLAVRGPTGIAYWQNEHPGVGDRQHEDTLDGWSLVDDIYRKDEDGWLWFETRLDNMIVSGGRQIAAPEVEEVLNDHPAVAESAVVGKPDETRGEIVKAFVTLTDDATPDDTLVTDLQDHTKSAMAKYKYPREIEFLDELPKDEVGKLQRAQLREQG